MNKTLVAAAVLAVVGVASVGYVAHAENRSVFRTVVSHILVAIGKEPSQAEKDAYDKRWKEYQERLVKAEAEAAERRAAYWDHRIKKDEETSAEFHAYMAKRRAELGED
jgi:hypothetical protein